MSETKWTEYMDEGKLTLPQWDKDIINYCKIDLKDDLLEFVFISSIQYKFFCKNSFSEVSSLELTFRIFSYKYIFALHKRGDAGFQCYLFYIKNKFSLDHEWGKWEEFTNWNKEDYVPYELIGKMMGRGGNEESGLTMRRIMNYVEGMCKYDYESRLSSGEGSPLKGYSPGFGFNSYIPPNI